MPSPVPGMNPYLERPAKFNGFHQKFPVYAIEKLVPQVRPRYFVDTDVDVYIHEPPAERRSLVGRPDVHVAERPTDRPMVRTAHARVAAPSTSILPLDVDEIELPRVEIRDKDDNRLVTVIELLSPTNKIELEHRGKYTEKRRKLLRAGVNLVEIDLLRGGQRMPLQPVPPCDYLVVVCRADEQPSAGVWPISLRSALPVIPVPLKPGDGDATLDLQAILHTIYDQAGYIDHLYQGPVDPPSPPTKTPGPARSSTRICVKQVCDE
jgi:hypothetical protein